mgnify:CR=1 FL=1
MKQETQDNALALASIPNDVSRYRCTRKSLRCMCDDRPHRENGGGAVGSGAVGSGAVSGGYSSQTNSPHYI